MTDRPEVYGKKRNWRKIRSYFVLSCVALLMVLKFQNCAPAAGGGSSSTPGTTSNGVVTTIDDINSGLNVSFNVAALKVRSTADAVDLFGKCPLDQNDAVLGWRLLDGETSDELGRGYATCSQGAFQIELAPAQDLECGRPYSVVAYLGGTESATITLERDCM